MNSVAGFAHAHQPPRAWAVVAAAAVAMMFSAAGIWAPTLGIFLAPLQHDLGWSQTQVYFGVTLAYLLAQLAAPLSGWIVDRGQVRRLMLGALLLQVLAFAGFSRIGPALLPYYLLCALTALATLGVSAIPLVRIVNGWFSRRRGLALGVLFAASTIGPMLHPLLAQRLIDSLGWLRFRQGRPQDALPLLQKAYAAFPDAEVATHLGEVMWALGEKDQAHSLLLQAAKNDPDNAQLRDAIKRLTP